MLLPFVTFSQWHDQSFSHSQIFLRSIRVDYFHHQLYISSFYSNKKEDLFQILKHFSSFFPFLRIIPLKLESKFIILSFFFFFF